MYPLWRQVAHAENIAVDIVCLSPTAPGLPDYHKILPPGRTGSGVDYSRLDEFTKQGERNQLRDSWLQRTAVGKFYESTFGPRHYGIAEVRRAITEAVEIISRFAPDLNNQVLVYEWPVQPKEPPFHLFWTRHRAIVAVALDRDTSGVAARRNKVQLIGYETTDPDVIERLNDVFNEWKETLRPKRIQAPKEVEPRPDSGSQRHEEGS